MEKFNVSVGLELTDSLTVWGLRRATVNSTFAEDLKTQYPVNLPLLCCSLPGIYDHEIWRMSEFTAATGIVIAVLRMVPNQPIALEVK